MIDTDEYRRFKLIWAVHWGRYGNEGFVLFTSKTKGRAEELIKAETGFRYNKEHRIWENDAKQQWYKVEEIEYLP